MMTRDEKLRFIRAMCNEVRNIALEAVEFMPDEWDGHELRQYLADKFACEVSNAMQDKRSKRAREYRRVIQITNH